MGMPLEMASCLARWVTPRILRASSLMMVPRKNLFNEGATTVMMAVNTTITMISSINVKALDNGEEKPKHF